MSLIGPQMGSLFRSLHQPAHFQKQESYDFDDLSLHEDKTRSVAVPERWLSWHLSMIWPTWPDVVLCLEGDSETQAVSPE